MLLDLSWHVQQAPPHSEEAEKAVLGALLLEPGLMAEVIEAVGPDDFYHARHQVLFAAMIELDRAGTTPDVVTLSSHLNNLGKLDVIGGPAYLATLDLDLPEVGRAAQYAAVVREAALRRRLLQSAVEIMRGCMDGKGLDELVIGSYRAIDEVQLQTASTGHYQALHDLAQVYGAALVDGEPEHLPGLPTGWPGIDAKLGGIRPGELYVVAAVPGGGKTAWAMQLALHLAKTGHATAIASLEMRAIELAGRGLSRSTGVHFGRMDRNSLSTDEYVRVFRCIASWREQRLPLHIDDTGGLTIDEVCQRLRSLHRTRQPLRCAIIDYAGLIEFTGQFRTRPDLEVALVTRRLKNLAKELSMPVILLAQFTAEGINYIHGGKEPGISNLAGSQAINRDAYSVLFLHRPYDEGSRTQLLPEGHFIVAKNRGGELGSVAAIFRGATMTWEEQ